MSLDIFFMNDVEARLTSLAVANKRTLALAVAFGMDPTAAKLVEVSYQGALQDASVSFGLALRSERARVRARPKRKAQSWDGLYPLTV